MRFLLGLVTKNPMVLIWIALGAFAFGAVTAGGMAWKIQGWRLDKVKAEYASFVAQTKTLGDAAKAAAKATEESHARTTKEIKNAIPKQIAAARSAAVRNYIASLPVSPGGSGLSASARGTSGIDEPAKEPIPCRPGFIEDSAEDAAALMAWQAWARGIGFPVK